MALATIRSRGLLAMSAPEVLVEVHLANGLPAFHIVGLPQAEVRESRERVRAALQHLGFDFPNRRITVNLAPADLPKESGRFDLPIALGILQASGQMPAVLPPDWGVDALDRIEAVGELSLTGELRPIRGAIAMALAVRRSGQDRVLMLPAANADEAALIDGIRLIGLRELAALLPVTDQAAAAASDADRAVTGGVAFSGSALSTIGPASPIYETAVDLADVSGQPVARRMLEIAAAGEHSLLLIGPPGAGKSMLAQRLPTILPLLSDEESAEVAALASLCGRFCPSHWGRRPFRAPHHSASAAALVGGGSNPRPGEISLAHQGVLFLDELPEYQRSVLEALREPLETGRITLSRALHHVDFPARFQFVAAMNPCPCGYLGSPEGRCRCSPDQVQRYRSRLSGPLLDRIDLRLDVAAVPPAALLSAPGGETSAAVRSRVQAARRKALVRQGHPNARLDGPTLQAICAADDAGTRLLHQAVTRLGLSARAMTRVQKVARTIADLADAARVDGQHLAEALQFRRAMAP